jgi:hypothetical protein
MARYVVRPMPDNKNQHYVPRCHLRPFSLGREGVAINLFNHARGVVRENVAVSGQCAKSYFYGKDLVVEKQLQKLEGRYATLVRDIEAGTQLDAADLDFLRSFAFLQWCRTDAALRRRREIIEAMDELARKGVEHLRADTPDLSQKSMVLGSLKIWATGQDDIADLAVLVLRNRSRVNFVTSDDPAVVTNRVFLQRMRDNNFGIANVGTMIIMPLGPRFALICYDHECYAPVRRAGNYVNVDRDQDARSLNELQFLSSLSNIYFADPIVSAGRIVADFRAVEAYRPEARFRTWQGISEGIDGEFECFRRLKDGEAFDPLLPRIQSFSPLYPTPLHWISNFRMRANLAGWVKPGTVGGPIRFRRASRHRGMVLVKIRIGPLRNRGGELPDRMYHLLSAEDRQRKQPSEQGRQGDPAAER